MENVDVDVGAVAVCGRAMADKNIRYDVRQAAGPDRQK